MGVCGERDLDWIASDCRAASHGDFRPTIDPTMAVTFEVEPTVTRSPTFTPPPPLAVPTFSPVAASLHGFPTGAAIIGLGLGGLLILVVSFIGRR